MATSLEPRSADAKPRRGWSIGFAITAFLALAGVFIIVSPTFQQCIHSEAADDRFFNRLISRGGCVVHAIDANEAFVVGVATVFVAIFTFTLWWSTKRLGDFAKQQGDDMRRSLQIASDAVHAARIIAGANEIMANAAERSLENERQALRIAAEAAAATKITAEATKLQAEFAREALRPRVHAQPWPHTARIENGNFRFQLELHCYGNSTATVTGLCVQHSNEPPRGERAAYTVDPVPVNIGLAPGNRWWYPEIQSEFFSAPIKQPFIFGYVRFENQFGEAYTSGYSAKLETTSDGKIALVTAGSPAWSRITQANRKE